MAIARKFGYFRLLLWALLLLTAGYIFYQLLIRRGLLLPLNQMPAVLCSGECPADVRVHVPPEGESLLNSRRSLASLIGAAPDKSKTSILIEKSKHRLTLYYDRQPLKSYAVVFGDPTGDKLREGDRRTPEGVLRIRDLYPHPSWSKFLWLDYPNERSWQKHFQAKASGQIGWSQSIGGEVGIHGVPAGADGMIDQRNNWTLGCPSLKNADVDELYRVVQVGTIVEIIP